MTFVTDVVRMLAGLPNAVDVQDTTGACSRGPRIESEIPVDDGTGLSKIRGLVMLELPTHHFPNLRVDDRLTVTDELRVKTTYVVRDLRKKGDGLTRMIYLVAA